MENRKQCILLYDHNLLIIEPIIISGIQKPILAKDDGGLKETNVNFCDRIRYMFSCITCDNRSFE